MPPMTRAARMTTAPARAPAASSDSSDDVAKEDELLGSKTKSNRLRELVDDGSSGGEEQPEAPRATAPKASGKSVETVESKASEEPGDALPASALEFGVGAKALFRQFSWTTDAQKVGPRLGLAVAWAGQRRSGSSSSGRVRTSGFAANVGLVGRFDYGFGVATTLANGNVVRDQVPGVPGRHQGPHPVRQRDPQCLPGLRAADLRYCPAGTPADLPQLAYAFARPALGTRVMFLPPTVALDAGAAFLMVLDPGSGAGHVRAASLFPNATSLGFDVSVLLAFRADSAPSGARAGAELRQYALSMNDKTMPTVAGAVDCYITGLRGRRGRARRHGRGRGWRRPAGQAVRSTRAATSPSQAMQRTNPSPLKTRESPPGGRPLADPLPRRRSRGAREK